MKENGKLKKIVKLKIEFNIDSFVMTFSCNCKLNKNKEIVQQSKK